MGYLWIYINFNSYILQYQYLLDTVELESETIYDQVIFEVVNTGNTTISVDNLLLQLDGAATKYTYNEKGKLATIKSKDKETIIERNNYRDISSITYDNIINELKKGNLLKNEDINLIEKGQNYIEIEEEGIKYVLIKCHHYTGNGIKRILNIITYYYTPCTLLLL